MTSSEQPALGVRGPAALGVGALGDLAALFVGSGLLRVVEEGGAVEEGDEEEERKGSGEGLRSGPRWWGLGVGMVTGGWGRIRQKMRCTERPCWHEGLAQSSGGWGGTVAGRPACLPT